MSENERSDQNGEAQCEEIEESILRGEAKFLNEASVEIEESNVGAAQIVVRGSDHLVRISVDLPREDTERVRDELTEQLAAE